MVVKFLLECEYVVPEVYVTDRQEEVLAFIRKFMRKFSYPPTVRDIGKGLGIGSPNGVMCHLKALGKKGLLALPKKGESRTIRLLEKGTCPYCGK